MSVVLFFEFSACRLTSPSYKSAKRVPKSNPDTTQLQPVPYFQSRFLLGYIAVVYQSNRQTPNAIKLPTPSNSQRHQTPNAIKRPCQNKPFISAARNCKSNPPGPDRAEISVPGRPDLCDLRYFADAPLQLCRKGIARVGPAEKVGVAQA